MVTDFKGFAVSPRRFHTPIRTLPHSRDSSSIESSLRFEGHISQSCGADIHSVHSFLAGTRRHSQTHSQRCCLGHTSFFMHGDRRVYSVLRIRPGIDPFIGHPSRSGKMPVYRAPCICSPIHRDTTTSIARVPSAKPPQPSFFGRAKRRTSSRYQTKESF